MNKFYALLFVLCVVLMAFLAGKKQEQINCRAIVAQNVNQTKSNAIKIQESVHEEVVSTAVDDIRRILHKKYTIAD